MFNMLKEKTGLNDIDSKYLEQVRSYEYFESVVNGYNSIQEEITERTALGNSAHYANQKIFKSKLLSKKDKLQQCWTISPVMKYASETWVLKKSMKQNY